MVAKITKRDFLKLAGMGGVVFASGLPGFNSAARAAGMAGADFHFVQLSDLGGVFEVSGPIGRHVEANEYDDPELVKLGTPTHSILNDAERRKASAKVFDYLTDNAYAFVIIPGGTVYTHTKEVKLNTSAPRALPVNPHEFTWK